VLELAQAGDIPPDDKSAGAIRQRARAKAWQAALQQPWGAPRTFTAHILESHCPRTFPILQRLLI